jgi:hypothetical protein
MDTFADLIFIINVNRTGWMIAEMTWANSYGIIVNEEDSPRIPTLPLTKYQISVLENGELTEGVVIPTKLSFLFTPDEITAVMEQLQQL